MSSQLKVVDLANRLNNFPKDQYLYIGGLCEVWRGRPARLYFST